MTIKSKLTLNAAIVLVIIVVVVLASVIGTGIVKSKLYELTERSTPFQTRSMEVQRAIHAATADLVKVGSAANQSELKSYRQEAEASLTQVKKAEEALEMLQGTKKLAAYNELNSQANDLFSVMDQRLKTEEGALNANNTLRTKVKDVAQRLKGLDQKIRDLQTVRSSTYTKSVVTTANIAGRLRDVENLKQLTKDMVVLIYELDAAKEEADREYIMFKGKQLAEQAVALARRLAQGAKNSQFSDIVEALSGLDEKFVQFVAVKKAFNPADRASVLNYEDVKRDMLAKTDSTMLLINVEVTKATEQHTGEVGQQTTIFGQVSKATAVLYGASELTYLGLSTEGLATRLFTVNSAKEVDELEAPLKEAFGKMEKSASTLDAALTDLKAAEERKMAASAMTGVSSMKQLLFANDGIISKVRNQLAMKQKAAKAMENLREMVLKRAEEAKKTMSVARGVQEQSIIAVNKVVRFSISLVIIIGIIAVIFGIAFGTWIYRSISKPLSRFIHVTHKIASGELVYETVAVTDDEIGKVEASMASMVTNLTDIVGKIRTATTGLASSSEELSATARALDKGSEDQANQVEQIASAMEEMTQTTEEVARNASETAEAAKAMESIALTGKKIVHSSGDELAKFVGTVNDAAQQVESLGKSSEDISNIVSLIRDVADQTNLLALNAAIEASHAGEQGRGFAVVADNVRQLAEKTVKAANDIAVMIEDMQGQIGHSVSSIRVQKDSVGKVSNQVQQTLGAIDDIVAYVGKVVDMVDRIAVAMQQQSATSTEVSMNMDNIAGVTRQLRLSSTEMRSTAEELSKIAFGLNETTKWFKV